MKRITKTLARFICLTLAIAMLAGCSNNSKQSQKSSDGTNKNASGHASSEESGNQKNDEIQFPLKKPIKLNVFSYAENVIEFETNEMTKWYEEKTNVKVDWTTTKDVNTDLNLSFASDKYPDIYLVRFTPEQVTLAYQNGIITPLNDLIDQYGENAMIRIQENPDFKNYLTAPDGNIYSLFYTDYGQHNLSPDKMFVYQKWIDSLGLDLPKTTEDFKKMLIAFRNDDPNGNNKKDEIPFTSSMSTWGGDPFSYFINPFEYTTTNGIYLDDNKALHFAPIKDGYKKGLKYMKDLYDNGLIAEETFIQDDTQLNSLVNVGNPDEATVGAVSAAWQGAFITSNSKDSAIRYEDYTPIEPLEGPTGLRQTPRSGDMFFQLADAITTSCPYPEVAMKWLDFWLSDEGAYQNYFGVENEDYNMVEEPSILGKTPSVKRLRSESELITSNRIWSVHTVPKYDSEDIRYGTTSVPGSQDDILYEAAKLYEPFSVYTNIPQIVWNTDEDKTEQISNLASAIDDYVKTSKVAFVLGTKNIDTEWDSYLEDLKSMGLDTYLQRAEQYNATLEKSDK